MALEKWEKHKKRDTLAWIDPDEALFFSIGIYVFLNFRSVALVFVLAVILWYWFKIRNVERGIIKKKQDIYNIYYDNVEPVAQPLIDKRTERDRIPMRYDLEQLENRRRFLVDKFVAVNLILVLLVNLLIAK